jgi:hypothetical protein
MIRCGSCGMPLHDDTRGTEADGTPSDTYCLACYAKGAFTLPDGPMEAVQARAIDAILAHGVPPLAAKKLTENIAELARWT